MLATSDTVVPDAKVLSSRASFVNLTRPSGATSAHGEAGYVGDPSEEKASLASSLVNLANTVVFYGGLQSPLWRPSSLRWPVR